jgi:hypothetical protein
MSLYALGYTMHRMSGHNWMGFEICWMDRCFHLMTCVIPLLEDGTCTVVG